ncbi:MULTISPECIES: WcaF family extracellular polysaccharide biosynthesis acetyltransferase [Paenibacillus]|jgi:putative colanic acid biosynthesis acetyltransferase WcaF|uniref:Colanic acid biosynthesis acetyltransferase WcaF n=1 Tax=Paenibacillus borealis TaxID=160799 RepID=A0ABX3HIB4_PAEBO|nr:MULTISPECIES: WcaF family extracellular polysaccharide biosynthesis acetyltransferase [Paenibacillus]AIQ16193.1 acyl transferase [Paenibacillus sp. FSL H7-0357]OMD50351.1 colanic acid biosynthesis acetyltransferase WcaF [Paenibacillus borealis]
MKMNLAKYDQSWFVRGRSGAVVMLWWLIQATVFRVSLHNMHGFRSALLRLFGAQVGKGVRIRPSAKFTYPWKVKIGDYSWIGDHAELYSLDSIVIGDHCVISQNAYLCTGSHKLNDPHFGLITKPIELKDGAWVASHVFVYPGVTIYEMGVAGARSTVMKDIPANQVHVGFPAVYFKERFTS